MKKLVIMLMVASFVFIGFTAIADDFKANIIERITDSVMLVRGPTGQGSGVVVGKSLMLTAYHVVDNKSGIDEMTLVRITDRYGNKYKAEVAFVDEDNDLAMLVLINDEFKAPVVKLAKKYEKGDPVFTIGYSLQGFEERGDKYLPDEDMTTKPVPRAGFGVLCDVRNTLVYYDIGNCSYGCSGGGLFNKNGRLIGIISLVIGDGSGKFGAARKINNKITFEMHKHIESKKKITDVTLTEKYEALVANIENTGRHIGNTRYGLPIYLATLQLPAGYVSEDEVTAEEYEIWQNAGRPDTHRIMYFYDKQNGLIIAEVRIWIHEGSGYEKKVMNMWVTFDYNIYKDENDHLIVERKAFDLVQAIEGYIVCDPYGLIMNTHNGLLSKYVTDKDRLKELIPKMEYWFNRYWDMFLAPHFNGG